MKKLISSILALTLVAGMSVTAFAVGNAGDLTLKSTTDINKTISGTKEYDNTYTETLDLRDVGIQIDDGLGSPAGTASVADASVAEINSEFGNDIVVSAAGTNNVALAVAGTTLSGSKLTITYTTEDEAYAAAPLDEFSFTVTVAVTDQNGTGTSTIDTRNIVYTGSFAAAAAGYTGGGWKIDDVVNGGDGVQMGSLAGHDVIGMAKGSTNNLANLDIRPDAEIKVYIDSGEFDWIDSNDKIQRVAGNIVSTSQLRNGKITVKKSVSKGSNVIEDISIDSDKTHGAFVLIEFVEYFVSVNEQDVDFTVYFAKKNAKRSGTDLDIAGTMENEVEEVDEDDDYVTCEEGIVVDPQAYVRGIEVYLGNGVTVTTNLFKDKKYYGVALNTYDATDSAILDEYPSIDNVLTLKTVNLTASGNIVSFDMNGDYYVYGADGTYLGLSTEKVVFSDKYYFSTERITLKGDDLDDDTDPIDDLGDDLGLDNEDLGGDDASNANDNPGTGVNGFVGVAVAAGLISLAAVGVTARKKK